jgi:hypothetical protein
MAEELNAGSLATARAAAEELSIGCSSPRTIDANMDILSSALLELGVVKVKAPTHRTIDLCETLQEFVKAGYASPAIVNCCRGIKDLIQVSDYDIADEDAFEEAALAEINVLQEELENVFVTLDDEIIDKDAE